jgi:carbohydrate-binding DOMON domain-containing protein
LNPMHLTTCALMVGLSIGPAVSAATLSLSDPSGDDFGPGSYTYPKNSAYTPGSFDLRKVEVKAKGSKVEIKVTLRAAIEDPWDSRGWTPAGQGFSLQMIQLYLDTDGKEGSGQTETLPGINAAFDAKDAWDRVVVISPQAPSRLRSEVQSKAGPLAPYVVVPTKVTVRGKTLVAIVKKKDLGGAPSSRWGVQAVVQSNEGYPDKGDLLSRKVNEYGGQHRFGGGNDWSCDPHVLDILAGSAKGGDDEIELQKSALAYTCGDGGSSVKRAILPMVRTP